MMRQEVTVYVEGSNHFESAHYFLKGFLVTM